MIFESCSAKETFEYGFQIGQEKLKGLFCLHGDLGSGKTTFIKGLISGACKVAPSSIHSPTFTYLNEYSKDEKKAYHFDLYRLKDESEFLALGFDEYLFLENLVCIEWSEKIFSLIPEWAIHIHLHLDGFEKRKIEIHEAFHL